MSRLGFVHGERSIGRPGEAEFRKWSYWYGSLPLESGISFYPMLRYRGARVYPEWWQSDAPTPILQCRLMGWDADSAGYTHDEQIMDGWVGVGSGDGATKWIHVDDLEKIEGPPPDGPF